MRKPNFCCIGFLIIESHLQHFILKCIDPLNLIKAISSYGPSLQGGQYGSGYKTSSAGKAGRKNSVNVRGRRHHRNRRLATSSQNTKGSSGKSYDKYSQLQSNLSDVYPTTGQTVTVSDMKGQVPTYCSSCYSRIQCLF